MFLVKSPILDRAKNNSGKTVYRQINGVTFVSTRPISYRKKSHFRMVRPEIKSLLKFYGSIAKFPDLINIWNDSDLPGSTAYHKIIKSNRCIYESNLLSLKNFIVPEGIQLKYELKNLSNTNIAILFSRGKIKSSLFIPPFSIYLIFYLFNGGDVQETFLSLRCNINLPDSELKALLKEDSYLFNIEFNKHEQMVLQHFKQAKVYCTILNKQMDTGKLIHSGSISFQKDLPLKNIKKKKTDCKVL